MEESRHRATFYDIEGSYNTVQYFWSNFSSKCRRVVAWSVGIYGAITCNLKSYMDYFIRHPSGSRVPMRWDPWTGL